MTLAQIKKNIKHGDYSILQKLLRLSTESAARQKFLRGDKDAVEGMIKIQENRSIFCDLHTDEDCSCHDDLKEAIKQKADKNHSHDWNEITGKPNEFPPIHHSHDVRDIEGLDDVLHTIDEIRNLSNQKLDRDGSNATGSLASTINNNHNHVNKAVLDTITASKVNDWDNAAGKAHNAVTLGSNATGLTITNQVLQFSNGYQLPTTIKINEWDDAYLKRHIHGNKAVLDNLTQSVIDQSHAHSNKSVIDGITTQMVNNWNGSFANSHTHNNKSTLDGISSADVTNWDTAHANNHTHANKVILDAITAAYTVAEKNKLATIQPNAQVNVKADWNATSGDAEILNKPTSFTPASHNHAISDVAGLQSELDSKLETPHLNGFVHDVAYNSSLHTLTFYQRNEPNIVIDLPIEHLIKGVQLQGNDLVFTFEDGSNVTIPMNTLLVGVVKSVNGLTANSQGEVVLNITDIPGLQNALDRKANVSGDNIPVGTNWNNLKAGGFGPYYYQDTNVGSNFYAVPVYENGLWQFTDSSGFKNWLDLDSSIIIYNSWSLNNASGIGSNNGMVNHTWFDYNWANTGLAGSGISFAGNSSYQTEIFAQYGGGGNLLGFRTRNDDVQIWNDVKWVWHNGNFDPDAKANISGNYQGLTVGNSTNWGGLPYVDSQVSTPNYFIAGAGNGTWQYAHISQVKAALGLDNYLDFTSQGQIVNSHKIFNTQSNNYYDAGVELRGNGTSVYPTLGFHQPGIKGSSLQMRNDWLLYWDEEVLATRNWVNSQLSSSSSLTWQDTLTNSPYATGLPIFNNTNAYKFVLQSRSSVGDNYFYFQNNAGVESHYLGLGSGSNDNFYFSTQYKNPWLFVSGGDTILQIRHDYLEMYRDLYVSNGGIIYTSNHGNSGQWQSAWVNGLVNRGDVYTSNIDLNNLPIENRIAGIHTGNGSGNANFPDYMNGSYGIHTRTVGGAFTTDTVYGNGGEMWYKTWYHPSGANGTDWRKVWDNVNLSDPATETWVTNNFISGSQLNNYLPLSGGTLTSGGRIASNGDITLSQVNVGGNATGMWWDDVNTGTGRISGIGALTSNGNFGYNYVGWGTSPWDMNTSLAVNDSFIRWKNQDLALASQIPTNNNQLSNGAGYITSNALNGYASQSWVNSQGFLTSASLPNVSNATITYQGTGAITGGGSHTINQSGNSTYNFDLTNQTKNQISLGVNAYNSLSSKQDTLVAGSGISIVGNTISATNSGGGSGIERIFTDNSSQSGPADEQSGVIFTSHEAYGLPQAEYKHEGNATIAIEDSKTLHLFSSYDSVHTIQTSGNNVHIDIDSIRAHIYNVVKFQAGSNHISVSFPNGIYAGDQINISAQRGTMIYINTPNLISSVGAEIPSHANLVWDPGSQAWVVKSFGY